MPEPSWEALGAFIRQQREQAQLSLRQLAGRANFSNAYLSQIERGIHKPSAQIMKRLADALHISALSLYERVGLIETTTVEDAIRADGRLNEDQKDAMIRVYRGFVGP